MQPADPQSVIEGPHWVDTLIRAGLVSLVRRRTWVMGKILFSLTFATALLAFASSEASAFVYSSFVCQAVGVRSVEWGRSFFVGDAKMIALSRCARRSGICTISYCVPGYWLVITNTPSVDREAIIRLTRCDPRSNRCQGVSVVASRQEGENPGLSGLTAFLI